MTFYFYAFVDCGKKSLSMLYFYKQEVRMAALKPVQPSVCDDSRVWKKICKTVMSKPDPKKIEELEKLAEKFKKVIKK